MECFVPAPKSGRRPAKYGRCEIVNALLYIDRTGCRWRALPHDFLPRGRCTGISAAGRRTASWTDSTTSSVATASIIDDGTGSASPVARSSCSGSGCGSMIGGSKRNRLTFARSRQ
ncbi:MAG: transposase [Isosphaeraceae bacterium]